MENKEIHLTPIEKQIYQVLKENDTDHKDISLKVYGYYDKYSHLSISSYLSKMRKKGIEISSYKRAKILSLKDVHVKNSQTIKNKIKQALQGKKLTYQELGLLIYGQDYKKKMKTLYTYMKLLKREGFDIPSQLKAYNLSSTNELYSKFSRVEVKIIKALDTEPLDYDQLRIKIYGMKSKKKIRVLFSHISHLRSKGVKISKLNGRARGTLKLLEKVI